MHSSESLDGKVALVTGGGSGIGKSIAHALAGAGARILINDLRDIGSDVASELDGVFIKADLAEMDQTRELCRQALDQKGHVDILINNAGLQQIGPVDEYPDETWAKLINIMLIAPFQLTKYLLPSMKKRSWGRIVNISSIHGLVASPFKSAYIAAKHGLVGLTKTVALEVGTYGITVNAICPGYVRTPLVEGQIADQARSYGISEDEVVEKIMLEPAAIKRLIEPDEIARLALFLTSDASRSITGASYTIDAGWTAR